jgi:hypothetical protein
MRMQTTTAGLAAIQAANPAAVRWSLTAVDQRNNVR